MSPLKLLQTGASARALPPRTDQRPDGSPLAAGGRAILRTVGSVALFSFVLNILLFVSPLYMLQVYDRVLSSRSVGTLIAITVIAGVLLAVYGLLETVRGRVLVRAGVMFDETVAQVVFDAIHRGILRKPDAGLAQGLRDVDMLREFLTGAGVIALCDVPWFPVFVFGSFLLHPWFGWIAIFGELVIWGLTLLNEILTRRDLTRATAASMAASQHASSVFRNVEVLQAMGMLGALRSIWTGMHLRHMGWQAQASDRAGSLMAGIKFFRMFLQIVILGTGGYLAIQREISPGGIIAGSILIGRALQPMEIAVGNWKGFVAARGAYKHLKSLFELAGTAQPRMSLPRPKGALNVENIIAGAPGKTGAILRGVTFALPANDVMCIVGPRGAGKTTLARLLVGVWPSRLGTLRLDGYDLSQSGTTRSLANTSAISRKTWSCSQAQLLRISAGSRSASTRPMSSLPRSWPTIMTWSRTWNRAIIRRLAKVATHCPVGSASGSPWLGHFTAIPASWVWMNPIPTSILPVKTLSPEPSRR